MGLTTEQKEKRRHDPRVQHIKKCICNKESGKPYVFISYKSDDWEPVLQDVVYKLVKDYGLNIYFDGDFDSNSIGWLEQFRTNMRSDLCRGILVFRSARYMTSYATVLELMYSQSGLADSVQKKLPIICVDLESQNDGEKYNRESCGLLDSGTESEEEQFYDILLVLSGKNIKGVEHSTLVEYKEEKKEGTIQKGLCYRIAEELLENTHHKKWTEIDIIRDTIAKACGQDVFDKKIMPEVPGLVPETAIYTPNNQAPASQVYTPPVAEGYTYTLFGQTYHAGSREQGKLMYDTFAALVQRFPDRIPALTRRTSVARAEDVTNANTREAKPPYFRICRSFPVNGQNYLVGISYGFEAKLAEIRGMLKLCGVNPAEFVLIQGGASSTANTTPASVSSSPSAPERAATGPAASPADGGTVFRYTLWGTLCTADTLANLMHEVFDRIAERYPDKVPQMAADNSLSAVARRDDVDNSRLPANKLNYFKACRLHTVAGQEYYVSTRYGREQGIAQLEKMLRVCEGRSDALEILSAPQKSVHNRSN